MVVAWALMQAKGACRPAHSLTHGTSNYSDSVYAMSRSSLTATPQGRLSSFSAPGGVVDHLPERPQIKCRLKNDARSSTNWRVVAEAPGVGRFPAESSAPACSDVLFGAEFLNRWHRVELRLHGFRSKDQSAALL